jgi:hypothetical protein
MTLLRISLPGEVRNFKPTPSLPMTRLLALSVSVSTAPNRNAIQAVDFILLSPFFFLDCLSTKDV